MEDFDEVELKELEELEKLHKATEKYLKKSSEKKEDSEKPVEKVVYKNEITSVDDIKYACDQVIPKENYEIGHKENGLFRTSSPYPESAPEKTVSLTIHFPKIDLVNDDLEPINHTIRDFYIVIYFNLIKDGYSIFETIQGFRTTFSLSELTKRYIHSHMNIDDALTQEIYPSFFCIGEDDIFRNRIKYNKIKNVGNLMLFLNTVVEAVGVESKQGVPYIEAYGLPKIEDYLQVNADKITFKDLLEASLKSGPTLPTLFNLLKIEFDKEKILKSLSKIVRFSSGDKEIYIDFYKDIDSTTDFLDLLSDKIMSTHIYTDYSTYTDPNKNDKLLNSNLHITEKGIFISKGSDNSYINELKRKLQEADDYMPSIYFNGEQRFIEIYDRDMLENPIEDLKIYKTYSKGAVIVYGIVEALREFKIETMKKLKAC